MNAIRIRRTIDSETLHLPELRPLFGRTVEIIVLEDAGAASVRPGSGDWEAAEQAVRSLRNYDFDAARDQDACEQHLP